MTLWPQYLHSTTGLCSMGRWRSHLHYQETPGYTSVALGHENIQRGQSFAQASPAVCRTRFPASLESKASAVVQTRPIIKPQSLYWCIPGHDNDAAVSSKIYKYTAYLLL